MGNAGGLHHQPPLSTSGHVGTLNRTQCTMGNVSSYNSSSPAIEINQTPSTASPNAICKGEWCLRKPNSLNHLVAESKGYLCSQSCLVFYLNQCLLTVYWLYSDPEITSSVLWSDLKAAEKDKDEAVLTLTKLPSLLTPQDVVSERWSSSQGPRGGAGLGLAPPSRDTPGMVLREERGREPGPWDGAGQLLHG